MATSNNQVERRDNVASGKLEYRLHVLEKNNYTIWKAHMRNVLEAKGLITAVQSDDVDSTREVQARALLTSALSDDNQMKVINCGTAHKIWKRLESIHENKSSFERENLLNKLHSYKIRSAKDVSAAVSDMENIAAKLRLLGETVSEESIMSAILRALPKQFSTFVTIWKGTATSERTIDNLLTRLMSEVADGEPEERALVAGRKRIGQGPGRGGAENPGYSTGLRPNDSRPRISPRFKNYSRRQMSPRSGPRYKSTESGRPYKRRGSGITECYHCGKTGHIKRDCWGLRDRDRGNNRKGGLHVTDTREPRVRALVSTLRPHDDLWIADSGASAHMTPNFDWIRDYQCLSRDLEISLGDNSKMKALGVGQVLTQQGMLREVYYVPDAASNLFSESSCAKKGIIIVTKGDRKIFLDGDKPIFSAKLREGLYELELDVIPAACHVKSAKVSLKKWHERLGHVSVDKIKKMARDDLVEGLNVGDLNEQFECADCAISKSQRASHASRTTEKIDEPGRSLHLDTFGPIQVESLGGAQYALICKDEYSGYRLIYLSKHKYDIPDKVWECLTQARLDTGNEVLKVTTDNGSEFVNKQLKELYASRGIVHQVTVPYTPEQNGLIEREMRTVTEAAKTMLRRSGLGEELWAEAMNTAVYTLNRTIYSRTGKTPYELWFGRKPDVKNMHIFGQKAVVRFPRKGSKFENKGIMLVFLGYTERFNTYRFLDTETNTLVISCDCKFLEDDTAETAQAQVEDSLQKESPLVTSDEVVEEIEDDANESLQIDAETCRDESMHDDTVEDTDSTVIDDPIYENIPRRLFIRNKAPTILGTKLRPNPKPNLHARLSTIEAGDDPNSYREAMARQDKDEWHAAMIEELNSLKKNEVWELVDRPTNTNIVTNRWVLRIKRKPDGSVERYKARLVARGFSQVYGIDYNETYAPVVNTTAIRLLLAHAAKEKLKMAQFDVKTAFLYGSLDEDIYMEQPEGFGKDASKVCHLKKSLYGLKQAPRQWNKKFSDFLKSANLKILENDECIFYREDPLMMVAIYVDDGIILARDDKDIAQMIKELQTAFEIHLVTGSTYLGFQIEKGNDGEIMIHQASYINKILKRFNMDKANPVDSPVVVSRGEVSSEPLDEKVPYREAIGSLMYAAVTTRLDIAYAVGRASRKVSCPTKQDWEDVKRIFRYLVDKQDLGIAYGGDSERELEAYCDADFAGDHDTNRSTTGLMIMYAGAPIHWRSARQSLVTLSSTEAEVVSLCTTTKDIMWLRKLASELNIVKDEPIQINCDNQSAIKITTKPKSIQRTRHMSAQAAYVAEQANDKKIAVKHVKADDQLADMLTKATTAKKFASNCSMLMKVMALVMCLMTATNALVFERVAPIVWTDMKKAVQKHYKVHRVNVKFISPCPLLEQVMLDRRKRQIELPAIPPPNGAYINAPNQPFVVQGGVRPDLQQSPMIIQQSEDVKRAMSEALKHCDIMYKDFVESPVNEAAKIVLKKANIRSKRSTSDLVVGFFFSNILTTVMDKLFYSPSSQEIKERNQLINEKINMLNREINMTMVVEHAMTAALQSMSEVVKHTQNRLSKFVNTFPHLTFTTNFLVMKMMRKGDAISKIVYEAKRTNKLDLYALSILLDADLYDDMDENTVYIKGIYLNSGYLTIDFMGHTVDNSTTVYRVDPFRYWGNLTGEPTLMEYVGDRYLIYNETSNCVKAISEPSSRFVSQRCVEENGVDKRLAVWRKVLTVEDPYKQPAATDVKLSWPYNYVYCYRLNITLKGETERCPPYVFKVNYTLGWNTTDYVQEAATREEVERALEFEVKTHSIHTVHFKENEHLVDENHALDVIRKLNDELRQMHTQNLAVSLPIAGGGITNRFMIKILIIGLNLMLLMIVILSVYKHKNDTRRHRKVMRTMTDGIYGDGTYDTVRRASVKSLNPAQVNVTFNSKSGQEAPELPARDLRCSLSK